MDDDSYYDDEGNEPVKMYRVKAKVSYEVSVDVEACDEIDAREIATDALNDYGGELPSAHDDEYEILEITEVPDEV